MTAFGHKAINTLEWIGSNVAWATWIWAMVESMITPVVALLGAAVLMWYNAERAKKTRAERRLLEAQLKKIELDPDVQLPTQEEQPGA